MEEVDSIILRRLVEIGCELDGNLKSLKNFTPSDLSQSAVRCLRLINPDVHLAYSKLPENVALRFRFATSLADAVSGLGYKGNIGYQTILYGSEADMRRLLMFLIEKLPKDGVDSLALSTTALSGCELTKRVASDRIRQELQAPKCPWFCKTYDSELLNLFWRQPSVLGDATFQSDFISADQDLTGNLKSFQRIPSSVMVLTSLLFSSDQDQPRSQRIVGIDELSVLSHAHQLASSQVSFQSGPISAARRIKPPLPPKPARVVQNIPEKADAENEAVQAAAEEAERQKEALSRDIALMQVEVEEKNAEISRLRELANEVQSVIRKLEDLLVVKQADTKQLSMTVELAPNVEEHVKQLQEYIGKSDARIEKLSATRDELCTPLRQQIAEIKQTSTKKPESERLTEEIAILERKARETASEMQAKKSHSQTLQREYDRMEKDINRAHYTKRILEIVANVNKQKQEIQRILLDIQHAQKDVNMLSGKLDRSFTATDELLYKDATRDDFIKRAYKCFVSLHEYCGNIVVHIENAGHCEREMRDLEDQIDTESQRSVDATLETLVNDYCEMKQANETLLDRLKQLGIKF